MCLDVHFDSTYKRSSHNEHYTLFPVSLFKYRQVFPRTENFLCFPVQNSIIVTSKVHIGVYVIFTKFNDLSCFACKVNILIPIGGSCIHTKVFSDVGFLCAVLEVQTFG